MGKKKITLKDIAKEVGVSAASVSMVLSGKNLNRFTTSTIESIYETTKRFGYVQPSKSRGNPLILIVCPSVINPYYATIIQGMESEALDQHLDTLIITTYWDVEKEKKVAQYASMPRVSGVIFAMIPQQPHLIAPLHKKLPIVAVGDKQNNLGIDTVDVNNFEAGYMVGKHLMELGHHHVAYVSTSLNREHSARVRRLEGLKKAYHESFPKEDVSIFSSDVTSLQELRILNIEHITGYKLTQKILKEHPEITAIVAINDMVAYGVIHAIQEANLPIPSHISVSGFDNIYPSQYNSIPLTTVEHSILQRGKSAVRLMANKIRKIAVDEADSGAVTRVEYMSRLIMRDSTGKVRSEE
ncbi:MAG: LacI family transcriptional regulator [Spirochaetia bacterium]|nr:LacI family transcriptional regulator [Spirochaetia bacterium]